MNRSESAAPASRTRLSRRIALKSLAFCPYSHSNILVRSCRSRGYSGVGWSRICRPDVASARRNDAAAFVRMNPVLAANTRKILERVKRSDSNFSFDFCQRRQLLTPSAYFRVGRIVGRFVRRSTWLACRSKLVLPLWKSVKDWW
jgi:hypothetical protein